MSHKRKVSNARNWVEMEGDTALEKKLNSLLSVSYRGDVEVTADECLEHAINIIELRANDGKYGTVPDYLEKHFYIRPSQNLLDKIDLVFKRWNETKQKTDFFQ